MDMAKVYVDAYYFIFFQEMPWKYAKNSCYSIIPYWESI